MAEKNVHDGGPPPRALSMNPNAIDLRWVKVGMDRQENLRGHTTQLRSRELK
ncbi:MAG TPA: hypothetical protein VF977_04550 [Candidatus Binatia bacterium]